DCYTVESFVARKPQKRRSDRPCPCDCTNLGVGDLIEAYPPIVAGPPNQFGRFLPHCVTFAADVVYKPRQTLKGVLLHGMNVTGVVHRLAPPVVNTEFKIDRFDLG